MADFQMWIVSTFARAEPVAALMHTKWAWPICESLHFMGLSLLVGSIVLFDLRLIGVGPQIPIHALHRLIPVGLVGFCLNLITGSLFLLTEPDQYVYNRSFHFKVLFIMIAGVNASAFYLTSYRRATEAGAPSQAPRIAKVIGLVSIAMWLGVIIAGRLLTFYRPDPCGPDGPQFISRCIPNYYEARQGRSGN